MWKLNLRNVKSLVWGHPSRKSWSWHSNPGLCEPRAQILNQLYFLFHVHINLDFNLFLDSWAIHNIYTYMFIRKIATNFLSYINNILHIPKMVKVSVWLKRQKQCMYTINSWHLVFIVWQQIKLVLSGQFHIKSEMNIKLYTLTLEKRGRIFNFGRHFPLFIAYEVLF